MSVNSSQRDLSMVPACLGILAALLAVIPSNALAQRIKLDDLIEQHLASIAPAERRNAVQNLVINGTSSIEYQLGGIRDVAGSATITSAMGKRLIAMEFDYPLYPGERFLFNGESVVVGRITPTERSVLGDFLYQFRMFIREGLLGGTLTLGWPLVDLEATNPRLNYRGLRKTEGRRLHDVEFRPHRGQSDFTVHLYFEPDTFRHVMTRYQMVQQDENLHYLIVERFSDFLEEEGLTLPHTYEMQLSIPGRIQLWKMGLTKYQTNLDLDPGAFDVEFTKGYKEPSG